MVLALPWLFACGADAQIGESPVATVETRIEDSPLATWDSTGSGTFLDAIIGQGVLDVTKGCVRLRLSNCKTVLLVWPEPTSWNATAQAIEFVGPLGERAELRDGDRITPGGATPIRAPQYVLRPNPECEADETFIVNSIQLVTD